MDQCGKSHTPKKSLLLKMILKDNVEWAVVYTYEKFIVFVVMN